MITSDFLLEIGCEELPARIQPKLANQLKDNISRNLVDHGLEFNSIHCYVSPRRLAIVVTQLIACAPSQTIQKLGPSTTHAYDKDGIPTMACMGFAGSCGISADQLSTIKTPKGERICALIKENGKQTIDVLPEIVKDSIKSLHIPKPMYWGEHTSSFIRPVHWIVMMYGETILDASLFDIKASNISYGHRFHHPKPMHIKSPSEYRMQMHTQGYVIADFNERKKKILKQIKATTKSAHKPLIDESLLDEVTALVEWPVVLHGKFNPEFLTIPREVLMTAMQSHQKCFPVEDTAGKLAASFIMVSNIESISPETVISGNEKVIHARLSDAAFFYNNDCKKGIHYFKKQLSTVLFQEKLGSIQDKAQRISKLAVHIGKAFEADTDIIKKSAALCKADLVSEMVVEFPSLQGTMGYYYALSGEQDTACCAQAIKEHYYPRFAKDGLPSSIAGSVIALADRIDTLVGIIGIKQIPTGDKDPFGLRRGALGIIRILINSSINIDILGLIKKSVKDYGDILTNDNVITQTMDFILARLKAWYLDKEITSHVFSSVAACNITDLYDFSLRIKAVSAFIKLPEAQSLSQANKRVSNLLKKQDTLAKKNSVNSKLFESPAEHALANEIDIQQQDITTMLQQMSYTEALTSLARLHNPIDEFFDSVMVLDKDEAKRKNRLHLLASLHALFLQVADISLLQH